VRRTRGAVAGLHMARCSGEATTAGTIHVRTRTVVAFHFCIHCVCRWGLFNYNYDDSMCMEYVEE
jgi:hypothetical protein